MKKNKEISDVCILIQSRLGSKRLPKKMLRPFCNTTLIDILFEKLKKSKIFPVKNIIFSAWEPELKEVAKKHNINIFDRSENSAKSEGHKINEIFEWHSTLPFKYVIMVSACNPLLKIETIDSFVKSFLNNQKENSFGVFEKKTYFWDTNKITMTNWKNCNFMNTKLVDPIYEAAHCLYASRMDIISQGHWMSKECPPKYDLFVINEKETFDIDYEWQFEVGEILYNKFMKETT